MANSKVLVEFQIVQKGKNFAILQKEQDKHNKSLDTADKKNKKLNKSQDQVYTRQKQGVIQTANSTKNFSKLSSTVGGDGGGPGGLVRAYALLAANVFALTAAFGVLSRSAQIDTLTESMKILSTTGGTFIENLAKQMRDASGGAIDLAQAFRQVSLASSAGLSTKEIEGLTLVARGAAISLGRNLPDAMDRIFRGAIKLEPEILDEIGLFVRVDEAAAKYAATLSGKTASSLSQAEKRQGFLNEILRQGTEKFEEYATAVEPDVYVKLAAALADIAQSGLSLMGSVLNPMIGVLAENKAVLGAVFGTLVVLLLKKAIPAMGLFTKSQAENAAIAAANAQKYTKDIEDGVNAKIKADKKIIKSSIKTAKQTSRVGGFGTVGSKDIKAQEKVILGLQNKKIKNEERAELVKKRIEKLETKSGFQKRMQNKLAKQEYDALIKERNEEEKLLNIQKQKVSLDSTSLGFKRQEALDRKARASAVLAESTGLMETSSISAGWTNLNEKLKETEVISTSTGDKTVKKFGLMERSSMRLKGGVAAVTTGFSKLMMFLGPVMMMVGMLTPVVLFLAKKWGILSEESKAAAEAISQAEKSAENFEKRAKKQTDTLKDQNASYKVTKQAAIAYANAQFGAFEGLQKINEKMESFRNEATGAALAWENFKAMFGLDKESKALEAQLDQFVKTFEASIRAGDDDLAKLFIEMPGFEEYKNTILELIDFEEQAAEARSKAAGGANKILTKENRDLATNMKNRLMDRKREQDALDKMAMDGIDNYITVGMKTRIKMIDAEFAALKKGNPLLAAYAVLLAKIGIARKDAYGMNPTTTGAKARKSLEENPEANLVLQEKGFELTKKQQQAQIALKLALDTSKEAATKFGKSFAMNTKVDDIVAGYKDLNMSLDGMEGNVIVNGKAVSRTSEEWKKFLESVENGNEHFSKYFMSMEAGTKITKELFKKTMQPILEYQKAILVTQAVTKQFVAENKRLTKILSAGKKMADDRAANETKAAKMQLKLATLLADVSINANNLSREQVRTKFALLQIETSLLSVAQQKEVTEMNAANIAGLQMLLLAESERKVEAKLLAETETQRAGIAYNKELLKQVKANEKLANLKQKSLELEQEIQSFLTGGTGERSGIQVARAEIDAAKTKLNFTMQTVSLQKVILDYEMEVLQKRVQVHALETGQATQKVLVAAKPGTPATDEIRYGPGRVIPAKPATAGTPAVLGPIVLNEAAQGFYDAVGNLSTTNKHVLDVTMHNAALEFSKSLVGATAAAFKPGSGSGITNAIRGAAAGVASSKAAGMNDKGEIGLTTKDKDGNTVPLLDEDGNQRMIQGLTDQAAAVQVLRASFQELAATMGDFGPAGIVVAGVAQGAMTIMTGMENQIAGNKAIADAVKDTTNEFTENDAALAKSAETAAMVGSALSGIGQMMAAQSAGQVAQIDQQIAAEKKRDGQSEASLAKIAALEKKKEAVERKAFDQNKKVQMAVTVANTASAIMAALSSPPIGLGPKLGMPMAIMAGAMGALQLAVIASTSYQGGGAGGVQKPKQTSLSIGERGNSVDVTRPKSSGELAYIRGERGTGTNANNFRTGGATGIRGYAAGQPIMVGEQGPERIDIIPNEDLGRSMGTTNVNFNISAVDGESVQRMLNDQQGNIIGMIQSAANETGEEFLPQVDPSVYGTGG